MLTYSETDVLATVIQSLLAIFGGHGSLDLTPSKSSRLSRLSNPPTSSSDPCTISIDRPIYSWFSNWIEAGQLARSGTIGLATIQTSIHPVSATIFSELNNIHTCTCTHDVTSNVSVCR